LTLTPWTELSPSFNLDTFVTDEGVRIEVTQEPDGTLRTTPVEEALAEAIETRMGFHFAMRAGMMVAFHLSDTWAVEAFGEYVTLGSWLGGRASIQVGTGWVFHWDDIVPAVLPAARRLAEESCEDVEARFRGCARWRELERPAPPSRPCPRAPEALDPASSPPPPADPAVPEPRPSSGPPRASFPPL
jgi:hypothetical protein